MTVDQEFAWKERQARAIARIKMGKYRETCGCHKTESANECMSRKARLPPKLMVAKGAVAISMRGE